MLEIWGRPYSSNVIPVIWTANELGLEYALQLAAPHPLVCRLSQRCIIYKLDLQILLAQCPQVGLWPFQRPNPDRAGTPSLLCILGADIKQHGLPYAQIILSRHPPAVYIPPPFPALARKKQ